MDFTNLSKKELISQIENLQQQLQEIRDPDPSIKAETYSDFFDNAPDMFFSVSPEGIILSVNPFGAQNLGYQQKELVGQEVWKVVHKDDLKIIKGRIQEILQKKIFRSELEFRKIKKDGSIIFVFEHTQLVFNKDGSIQKILIICRDITSRKEIENTLRSEEEKYRSLTNNLNLGVYRSSSDFDGYLIEANPAFAKMLGYKDKAELFKMNIIDFYSEPEGRKKFIDAIHKKGYVKNLEVSLLRKDKTNITCKISTVLIKDKQGNPLYYDGIVEDISNLKSAKKTLKSQNEFLHNILESLTHPFYVINVDDYSIEIANSAARKSSDLNLRTCYALTHNNDIPCNEKGEICPISEIKKTRKPYSVEHVHLDKSGEKKIYEVNAYPIFNSKQELKQIIEYTVDITERKETERTIKQHKELYRILFQMAPIGIVIENQNGVFIDANPAYCQSVGYKYEELIGQHVSLLTHAENAKKIEANIARIIKGEILKHVLKSMDKKGKIVYTELHERKIELPDGQPAILCFSRDITKQKEEQDQLIDKEKKFRNIFNAFPDIYFKANIDGVVKEISPSVEGITGFSIDEVVGKHSSQFYYSTDDWLRIREAFRDNDELKDIDTRLKIKKGGFIHCSFSARVNFNKYNKPVEIEGVLRDITDREKAKLEIRKLSRVVEQSPVIVVITNLDGNIEYVNPKFCEVTGYDYDEVIGKNPRVLKSGKTPQQTFVSLWKTITSGNEWHGEFMNRRKNNELYWESAYIFPLKDESGKITRFIAQKEDISARKKLELDLINARDKAEESDKLKSAFLANMSHEIRTPMNAILGFSQLLSEPDTNFEEQSHFINLIQNSGNDLLVLIDDIIDISKIEAGQIKIFNSDYFIDNILTDLHTSFSEYIKTRKRKDNLKLIYNKPHNAERVLIYTDIDRLKQIFINLLNNSIKFTDSGIVEFGFNFKQHKGQNVFNFYVSDTGIGIEQNKLDIIFNSFRQANDSNTRLYGGTGLGLAITKRLVELLGGKIEVSSIKGKGSTFSFTHPIRNDNDLLPNPKMKTHFDFDKKNNFKWSKKSLLVVEDDDTGYIFFERVFKNTGIQISRAITGVEAVNLSENYHFDIILMDIQLPEMDGLEATRLIKKSKPEIPIIAQTAFALAGEKEKCLKAGCDDYISKPIDISKLMRKVKLLLS